MAVKGDEARAIGKEAAERIVHGCRCGLAMWDAKTALLSLDAVLSTRRAGWSQPLPQFMKSILAVVEQDCGADMSEAKTLNTALESKIIKGDWWGAQDDLAALKLAVIEPVKANTANPPEYLGIKGKKYKLVGEETDERKAFLRAGSMTKSGENIVVVPLLGRYSLYRED